jgi:hypothetical protein
VKYSSKSLYKEINISHKEEEEIRKSSDIFFMKGDI